MPELNCNTYNIPHAELTGKHEFVHHRNYNVSTLLWEVKVPMESGEAMLFKWSADKLPNIGDRVKIRFNGLGFGKVQSYFVEDGFLGVAVLLEENPAWRQASIKTPALVFGSELANE